MEELARAAPASSTTEATTMVAAVKAGEVAGERAGMMASVAREMLLLRKSKKGGREGAADSTIRAKNDDKVGGGLSLCDHSMDDQSTTTKTSYQRAMILYSFERSQPVDWEQQQHQTPGE